MIKQASSYVYFSFNVFSVPKLTGRLTYVCNAYFILDIQYFFGGGQSLKFIFFPMNLFMQGHSDDFLQFQDGAIFCGGLLVCLLVVSASVFLNCIYVGLFECSWVAI